MNPKLRRWTLICSSMLLVLGTVATIQWFRGSSESRAEDRANGPIIPPGGPKPIPLPTGDTKPSDPFKARPNLLRPSMSQEPRALPTRDGNEKPLPANDSDDSTPPWRQDDAKSGSATARFVNNDQPLVSEPPRDPFHQRTATAAAGAGRYPVRTAANEEPADNKVPWPSNNATGAAPKPFPSLPATSDAGDTAAKPKPTGSAPPPWAGNPAPTVIPSTEPARTTPPAVAPAADPAKPQFGASNPPAVSPPTRVNPFNDEPPATKPAPFGGSAAPARPLNASPAVTTSEGTGRPGQKQLEGQQVPQLSVEKLAPREIQVGKPAVFETKVKNVGQAAAQNVEIYDEIPKGTQLLRTVPSASRGPRGELVWSLGPLKPNEEAKVQMELMPTAEGEVGSVATVHFRADASAKTICTKPELAMQVSAPKQVMIGEDVTFQLRVSNPGTGAASHIVLAEKVPAGLQHQAGTELEFDVGDLKPGESRQLDLTLKAVQPGPVVNLFTARGEGSLKTSERCDLEVVAPALKVGMTGPSKRYLERPASYTFSVSNPGTAAAKEIELVTYLPRGLKFVKANNSGSYDSRRHCVVWSLEELPASENGQVQMTALPIEEGEQKIRIEGKAQQGLTDATETSVVVEGVAAIYFEVVDLADPVEVNGETTYEVRVVNQGSKAASNLQLTAYLPPELKALAAEGPSRHTIEGGRVTFESLSRLNPKGDTAYRIRAQALRPGDVRVRVQVVTDEIKQPVTKEESTRIYADE